MKLHCRRTHQAGLHPLALVVRGTCDRCIGGHGLVDCVRHNQGRSSRHRGIDAVRLYVGHGCCDGDGHPRCDDRILGRHNPHDFHGCPTAHAGSSGRAPPQRSTAPSFRPAATYASTFSRCAAEISGPVRASLSNGPPSRIFLGPTAPPRPRTRRAARVLDQQPGAGRADLPGVQEHRHQGARRRAASSSASANTMLGVLPPSSRAILYGGGAGAMMRRREQHSGEGDQLHALMAPRALPAPPRAPHEVDDTFGHAGLLERLHRRMEVAG